MTRLTLYTTLGCHLCERLEAELARLGDPGIRLERIEIADDEALIERYGKRIPVLCDAQGGELERGFEPQRLVAWLEERELLASVATGAEGERASLTSGARNVRRRRFLG